MRLPAGDYGHYFEYTRAKVAVVDEETLGRLDADHPQAQWGQ